MLNVGVIGVGAFMARQHLPNLARDPRYCLHTFCDLDQELLARRAGEFRPERCTTDAGELLADPAIDVVFIGTRSRQHARFVEQAATHGKHAYVEKPMTMSCGSKAREDNGSSASRWTRSVPDGWRRRP